MDRELDIEAPLDHPCYAGHFPGRPIVPGVLLLDLVVAALGLGAPRALDSVKFHRALAPGERFTLRYRQAAKVTFRCLVDDKLIAEGTLSFA
jgi:3-hydroxyacyl-[acyl-carrier-protein] dehydratase